MEMCDLLTGSDETQRERAGFRKAVILFWLIEATDGHDKNFRITLMPGGRFRTTPTYDVLTVQPSLHAVTVQTKDMKLAMRSGCCSLQPLAPTRFADTAASDSYDAMLLTTPNKSSKRITWCLMLLRCSNTVAAH